MSRRKVGWRGGDAIETEIDGAAPAPQIQRVRAVVAANLTKETGVGVNDPKDGQYFRHHVFCCLNERPPTNPQGCCASKGAAGLRNYMKGQAKKMGLDDVRINTAGCLDRCHLGPTLVVYPQGIGIEPRRRPISMRS